MEGSGANGWSAAEAAVLSAINRVASDLSSFRTETTTALTNLTADVSTLKADVGTLKAARAQDEEDAQQEKQQQKGFNLSKIAIAVSAFSGVVGAAAVIGAVFLAHALGG